MKSEHEFIDEMWRLIDIMESEDAHLKAAKRYDRVFRLRQLAILAGMLVIATLLMLFDITPFAAALFLMVAAFWLDNGKLCKKHKRKGEVYSGNND